MVTFNPYFEPYTIKTTSFIKALLKIKVGTHL